MNIDLHLHTRFSDGDDTVDNLVDKLRKLNIDVFSVTDHDSVGAYDELEKMDLGSMKLVKGVEITCNYDNEIRDMLGYNININKMKELLKGFASHEKSVEREENLLRDYIALFKGNGIEFDSSNLKIRYGRKGEAYLEIFKEIRKVKKNYDLYPGLANPSKFFWDNCIEEDSKFYMNEAKYYTSIKDGIDIIHKADGLAFFAHPCIHYMPYDAVEKMLDAARSYGVDGVEILHSKHSMEDRKFLRDYAKKHNLLTSGGSDYHGSPKPDIKILEGRGDLKVEYEMVKDFI